MTTIIISNKETKKIIEIFKYLREYDGLLDKFVTRQWKMKEKNKNADFSAC